MDHHLEHIIAHNYATRTLWKLFKFGAVGAGGSIINLVVLFVATAFFHMYFIYSGAIGILCGYFWNFAGNVYVKNIPLD